jgi:hypothetical protein
MSKLTALKLNRLNSIVIRQTEGRDFFISAPNAIIFSIDGLSFILKFLVFNNFISPKVLSGILSEYNTMMEEDNAK